MPIVFDPATKRIVLDSTSVTAAELWSRWADWVTLSDNAKYLPAFRQAGGDDLGGGLSIPAYMFLLNGWRVRPMEANHALIITGNLFVDGGGVPVVGTLGAFNVSVQYTVPVQAQGISTGGGGGGLTTEQSQRLQDIWQRLGLDPANPQTTTATSIAAGGVQQSLAESAGTVTVTRLP